MTADNGTEALRISGSNRVKITQGLLEVGDHGVAGAQIVSDGGMAFHAGFNDSSTGNGDFTFRRYGESTTANTMATIFSTGNAFFGDSQTQANSSHFQYASTFGDNSYARVGFFNNATGNDSGRGLALQLGQIAGTSHYLADETELAIITFLGQANDAAYVGGSIAVKATTGGNIARAAVGCDMMFSTIDTSGAGAEERMRITDAGFVGINRSSDIHERLTVSGQICSLGSSFTSSTAGNQRAILDLTSNAARIGHFRGSNGAGSGGVQFFVDSTERMRISSAGCVSIGLTSAGDVGNAPGLCVLGTQSSVKAQFIDNDGSVDGNNVIGQFKFANVTDASNGHFIEFADSAGIVGEITANGGSNTAYTTSSDRRLKTNIKDISNQLDKINKIKVREYTWLKNDAPGIGMIAQELEKIIPEVVIVGGDDEKKRPYSIDYGRLTPWLIKAVQELSAKIDSQQKEIEELKS